MKKKRKWRELPWTVPRVQFRFVKEREDELDILNRRSSETQSIDLIQQGLPGERTYPNDPAVWFLFGLTKISSGFWKPNK